MRKAVRWILLAVVALIIIGAIAGGGKKRNSVNSTSPTPVVAPPVTTAQSTTAATSTQPATGSGVPKSGRCGDITVNQHTSCAFAQAVVKNYDAKPSTTFRARSPVTGLTYTMHCEQAQGVVACDDNSTSTLAFNGPPPASSEQSAPSSEPATETTQTAESVEGPGSLSHATRAAFCSTHQCIENFPNGSGSIVQCADGKWSHSGGRSGACSDHGGESQ